MAPIWGFSFSMGRMNYKGYNETSMKGIVMLSERNIREINTQIEKELRDMRGFFSDGVEVHVARIAALKSLLDPQPTQKDILEQLASALIEKKKTAPTSESSAIDLLITMFTQR